MSDIKYLRGMKGVVVEHHYGAIYDYIIKIDGDHVKVKETEIKLSE